MKIPIGLLVTGLSLTMYAQKPDRQHEETGVGIILTGEQIRNLPTRSINYCPMSVDYTSTKTPSRAVGGTYYIDGRPVYVDPPTSENSRSVLYGTVGDDTGEPLPGATVRVWSGEQLVSGAVSDSGGAYRLVVDPGAYTLEVTYVDAGFIRSAVMLRAGEAKSFNVELFPGRLLPEVVISARKIGLQTWCPSCFYETIDASSPTVLPRPDAERDETAPPVSIFPIPANQFVTFELQHDLDALIAYDAEGRITFERRNLAAGQFTVGLADVLPGFYSVHFVKDGQVQRGKLLVVKGL